MSNATTDKKSVLTIRVSRDEAQAIAEAAYKARLSINEFCRQVLAEKILKDDA